jgi:hypothetical protein
MSKKENELDATKPAWHFMPFAALDEVAMVFGYGAAKHGVGDYKGPDAPTERYNIGAALRHISLHMQGQKHDGDSGRAHIAHAVARLLIVLDSLKRQDAI